MNLSKNKASHAVLLEWPLGRNSGGPSGYLWHLRRGLERTGVSDRVTFVVPEQPTSLNSNKKGLARAIDHTASWSDGLWRLLKTYGPTTVAREKSMLLNTPLSSFAASALWDGILSDAKIKSFHCHTTFDGLRVHNNLQRIGRRAATRLILTSHCPEMPAHEKADLMRDNGLARQIERAVRSKLLEIDAAAFASADTLVFPCAEALEPYRETYPGFDNLLRNKDVRYVLTGIEEPPRGAPATNVFPKDTNILKLFYAGRHNAVKGYDLLVRSLPSFLDQQAAFIAVAGRRDPLVAPSHPGWRELGWISNATDIIAQADAFLLPNARTYFDLIALEVMALGKPLLASRTGGNKALAALSPGVILFDRSTDAFLAVLKDFASMSTVQRRQIGQANRAAYDRYFSSETFARSYVAEVLDR